MIRLQIKIKNNNDGPIFQDLALISEESTENEKQLVNFITVKDEAIMRKRLPFRVVAKEIENNNMEIYEDGKQEEVNGKQHEKEEEEEEEEEDEEEEEEAITGAGTEAGAREGARRCIGPEAESRAIVEAEERVTAGSKPIAVWKGSVNSTAEVPARTGVVVGGLKGELAAALGEEAVEGEVGVETVPEVGKITGERIGEESEVETKEGGTAKERKEFGEGALGEAGAETAGGVEARAGVDLEATTGEFAVVGRSVGKKQEEARSIASEKAKRKERAHAKAGIGAKIEVEEVRGAWKKVEEETAGEIGRKAEAGAGEVGGAIEKGGETATTQARNGGIVAAEAGFIGGRGAGGNGGPGAERGSEEERGSGTGVVGGEEEEEEEDEEEEGAITGAGAEAGAREGARRCIGPEAESRAIVEAEERVTAGSKPIAVWKGSVNSTAEVPARTGVVVGGLKGELAAALGEEAVEGEVGVETVPEVGKITGERIGEESEVETKEGGTAKERKEFGEGALGEAGAETAGGVEARAGVDLEATTGEFAVVGRSVGGKQEEARSIASEKAKRKERAHAKAGIGAKIEVEEGRGAWKKVEEGTAGEIGRKAEAGAGEVGGPIEKGGETATTQARNGGIVVAAEAGFIGGRGAGENEGPGAERGSEEERGSGTGVVGGAREGAGGTEGTATEGIKEGGEGAVMAEGEAVKLAREATEAVGERNESNNLNRSESTCLSLEEPGPSRFGQESFGNYDPSGPLVRTTSITKQGKGVIRDDVEETENCHAKDLLCFAWQIARGMVRSKKLLS